MFTGIVEEVGTIVSTGPEPGGGAALRIRGPLAAWGARQGDSIAVSGACLTVVDQPTAEEFVVDVMPETLRRTSLGSLQAGSPVNLERSLRADARLHGHIVQGHVDGVGHLLRRSEEGGWVELEVSVPAPLVGLVAEKGAVALNGVSLTITHVGGGTARRPVGQETDEGGRGVDAGEILEVGRGTDEGGARAGSLGVALIPETLRATNLGDLRLGDPVNIEVDVVARYVARLLEVGDMSLS
ncbi:riboflavin synthase [Actinomyces provencensis]|uniref:riboflavin synthase n=1 Tax=Actinomyces provencensis TaxID=1720198 RepID=UPI00096A3FED|nr:riboflavin synthase [Actinomyces provencensis]